MTISWTTNVTSHPNSMTIQVIQTGWGGTIRKTPKETCVRPIRIVEIPHIRWNHSQHIRYFVFSPSLICGRLYWIWLWMKTISMIILLINYITIIINILSTKECYQVASSPLNFKVYAKTLFYGTDRINYCRADVMYQSSTLSIYLGKHCLYIHYFSF